MSWRTVELPEAVSGTLWLGAMPGRLESWTSFVLAARRCRLSLVVCLTPHDEMLELSPAYASAVSRREAPFDGAADVPCQWLHLPARNYGLPHDPGAFRGGVAAVAQRLQSGDAVLLHCAAGIGRTGSTAACVLKALGMNGEAALQRVRDAGSNPEGAQQSGLVEWF